MPPTEVSRHADEMTPPRGTLSKRLERFGEVRGTSAPDSSFPAMNSPRTRILVGGFRLITDVSTLSNRPPLTPLLPPWALDLASVVPARSRPVATDSVSAEHGAVRNPRIRPLSTGHVLTSMSATGQERSSASLRRSRHVGVRPAVKLLVSTLANLRYGSAIPLLQHRSVCLDH